MIVLNKHLLCMAAVVFSGSQLEAGTCEHIGFEAPVQYQVETEGDNLTFIRCVATGDLDSDGDADVIASDRYGEEIVILLNDGEGNLEEWGSVFSEGCERNRIVILEDLDGNGLLDIASASTAGAAVFLNAGFDGEWLGFEPVMVYPSGFNPHWIDAVDLDLDGSLDLLVADFGEVDMETGWHAFLNNGDGTFAPGMETILGFDARCISINGTDLDGDGDPEIMIAGARLNGGFIHVFKNAGVDAKGGWLGPEYFVSIPVTYGACSIRALDRELDGDMDLVVAHRSQPELSLLVNDGTGMLALETMVVQTSAELAQPVEIDGDGFTDIALVVKNTGQLRLLINDGTGQFQDRGSTGGGVDPKFASFADLDDDGDMDCVMANSFPGQDYGSVSVHLNNSAVLESGCALDLNCDDLVSTGDLLIVLADWGPNPGQPGDVNGDGQVDVNDLLIIIAAWGPCIP